MLILLEFSISVVTTHIHSYKRLLFCYLKNAQHIHIKPHVEGEKSIKKAKLLRTILYFHEIYITKRTIFTRTYSALQYTILNFLKFPG